MTSEFDTFSWTFLGSLFALVATGALVGMLAVRLSKVRSRTAIFLDVTAGACGALLAAWFSGSTSADMPTLLLGILGATFLVGMEKIAMGGPR